MQRSRMKVGELIEALPIELASGSPHTWISGVKEDSRQVERGDLFVARRGGSADGRCYVEDAVRAGAVAVLCEATPAVPSGSVQGGAAPVILAARTDSDLGRLAGTLAERLHGRPSRRLHLIGVTGTNGKTTTTHLIQQILNRSGRRCGLVGTVCVDDGRNRSRASLTTPLGPELSAILARMVETGCAAAAAEVSSHALDQGRVAALSFEGAVFTNLTGDHLDYHGTMDAYRAAKATLFSMIEPTGWAVVNADDPAGAVMAQACRGRVLRTSCNEGGGAECTARIHERRIDGSSVTLRGPWGSFEIWLPLAGAHNVSNALQAAAACAALGVDAAALGTALASCQAPPGRLQPVSGRRDPFTVLVDYAHTDDALENVLGALRPLVCGPRRLRVVFGCGGDRDRTKRPRMAAVACRLADEVTITSDNPRREDPLAIIAEIWAGVPAERRTSVQRIADRREAIHQAIAGSAAGDVLLIAGKGHETEQIIGTQRHPFDDCQVAREALRRALRPEEECVA